MKKEGVIEVVKDINEKYGDDVALTLEKNKRSYLEGRFIPTGSLILNSNIHGGYPFGRIIEIFGQESSGKSTLALHAVNECQKMGKCAAFIDLENSLSIEYAKSIGIDENKLIVVYPSYGEQALDIVIDFIKRGVGLIVIDSVSALIPKDELFSSLDKTQTIGLKARMMSSAIPKINEALTKSDSVVIFINQLRNKISLNLPYPAQTTTGGVTLQYFSSLRIKLKKTAEIKNDNYPIGINIETSIVKNKVSPISPNFQLEVIFGKGIDEDREILFFAEKNNLVQKNGNWYSYNNEKMGNGKENALSYIKNNKNFSSEIKEILKKRLKDFFY